MSVKRSVFDRYLSLGLSVFPVHFVVEDNGKIGKRPSQSWKEFMSRLPTTEEVDAWFEKGEPQGIGLATGKVSGVVAVDVDTTDNPMLLTSSVVSKSAFSGGHHYLYKWSEEIRNTVKIDGMPIDFRGDGGYIVLPPSEHQGKIYIWESQDFANLQPLPEAVKKMLTTERKPKDKIFTGDQHDPYAEAFEGGRNDQAARVAGHIIKNMTPVSWNSIGWREMQWWNDNKCHPSLSEAELRTTYNSIINAESRTIVKEETQEVIDVPKPVALKDVAMKRLEERDLEKIAPSTGYKELDKFIRGFIPGHVYTMTGDTNVGKTTVCCNFADRVSKQGKTVLYFALEPENTLVDYLASIRTRKRFDQLSDTDLMESDDNISVYGKEQIQRVEDLVKVVDALPRYDFIVVDHIGYFTTDGADMNTKQGNVMKTLAALAKAKQCAIMIVAHIRKRQNNKVAIHEDDISGSASFKQDATEVLIISRKSEPDDDGNPMYTDDGVISVRKTKTGGGQGNVQITFKPGSALILDSTDLLTELWK